MLRRLAWVYAVGFLGVFLITHAPGRTDADGNLFGLFKIDPIDDIVHLLSGLAGAIPGGPDLSLTSWAINLPHVIIAGIALVVGFRGRAVSRPQPA